MDKFTNFGIMKLRILVILFFPLSLFSQDFNQKNIKYEDDIDSLIIKHQEINYLKNGIDGWRVQLAFKSTKEEIRASRLDFINKYPEIDTYLTYSSPYYKISVGNFREKIDALKLKDKIKREYIEAYPVPTIIPISELHK